MGDSCGLQTVSDVQEASDIGDAENDGVGALCVPLRDGLANRVDELSRQMAAREVGSDYCVVIEPPQGWGKGDDP